MQCSLRLPNIDLRMNERYPMETFLHNSTNIKNIRQEDPNFLSELQLVATFWRDCANRNFL